MFVMFLRTNGTIYLCLVIVCYNVQLFYAILLTYLFKSFTLKLFAAASNCAASLRVRVFSLNS